VLQVLSVIFDGRKKQPFGGRNSVTINRLQLLHTCCTLG